MFMLQCRSLEIYYIVAILEPIAFYYCKKYFWPMNYGGNPKIIIQDSVSNHGCIAITIVDTNFSQSILHHVFVVSMEWLCWNNHVWYEINLLCMCFRVISSWLH